MHNLWTEMVLRRCKRCRGAGVNRPAHTGDLQNVHSGVYVFNGRGCKKRRRLTLQRAVVQVDSLGDILTVRM